ncbi:LytR/AlgR family response regulator transcription factor [Flavobacterium sp. XS2P14]|uniref:LytR/AlgR family response regulator transcription factor n=1 Tax=Flavobacterium sp. XS2P14 TaxID=3401735 RepID=UPI003AAFC5C7
MQKVIIVDDESSGRKLIKEYLEYYPDYFIVGEANNGVDAVKIINEFKPDLVFLDIQMPGLTGFEVITYLEEIPQIIFSTAYDKYALKAFEVHAIDYLLKPYTQERFKMAMSRTSNTIEKLLPLAEKLLIDKPNYPDRILVQTSKKLITIAVKDIIRIEAYGDYSKLHVKDNCFLSNFGITTLATKLNPELFIRVHRSSIINISVIKELSKTSSSFDVLMSNNDNVRVSRGYLENIKKLKY